MKVRIKNFNELGWPSKLKNVWPDLTPPMYQYMDKVYIVNNEKIIAGEIDKYIKIGTWNWHIEWLEFLI